MNDPGLGEPIADAASIVQSKHEKRQENSAGPNVSEVQQEARWWYASTAFPLIAGTFGPMANAFSICALVQNWRVSIPKGGSEGHGIDIPDPKWLIAVNAVSLVFALIANLTLLLNMARRLSFRIAQPITILGFWIASVLLIALIAVASSHKYFHEPGVKDQALTQAYYYATFAAGLYQIISYLMMFTIYGALTSHYSKEFKLTTPQRTLMLQTICFLGYLLLGALVYSKIEGWKFLDAVYWADFTLLTIGIGGDYTPHTHLGRSLLFPFAIGGIVYLGLVVGSIRSLVLERTKKKLSARMTERLRRRVVKRIQTATSSRTSTKKIPGLDKWTSKSLTLEPRDQEDGEKRRREAEFHAMRAVQELAEREERWLSVIISGLAWLFLWMIGAVVFLKAEENQSWSYFECVYFAYTTLLTIGFGDFQPVSNSGKAFFVFWTLLAVPTLTILISNMSDTLIQLIKDLTIWLGEVTVLPSETGSIRESFKVGIMKLKGGKINVQGIRDSVDDIDDIEEMPPGLVRLPHRQRLHEHSHDNSDLEAAQELASDFEQSEKLDEDEARRRGDRIAQSIHHYRHMLIKEIRNIYADLNAPEPKKYSYEEWSYFLELLGEDEGDAKYHRKAPLTAEISEDQEVDDKKSTEKKDTVREGTSKNRTGKQIKQWSWIGDRSVLMRDKVEAEWVLEKLLERLEDELLREKKLSKQLRAKKEGETGEKQATLSWPPRPTDDSKRHARMFDEDEEKKSGGSLKTLEGQASGEEKGSRSTSSEDERGSRRCSMGEGKDSRPPQILEDV